MNAITLIQLALARDLVEKEGNHENALARGNLAERGSKCRSVLLYVVGWGFHPREDHDDVLLACARDDRREVFLHLIDRQAAQAIISAERDNQYANVTALERPVQPPKPACGRVPRHTGVHHFELVPFGVEA